MTTRAKQTLTPQQARTFKQICALPRDNLSTRQSWILVDVDTVHIHNQKSGHPSKGDVTLTRKEFDKFVRWYTTGKARP